MSATGSFAGGSWGLSSYLLTGGSSGSYGRGYRAQEGVSLSALARMKRR